MPASFLQDLVLDVEARDAGAGVLRQRVGNGDGAAVPRVHVRDQRGAASRGQIRNHLRVCPHVVELGYAEVGHPEAGRRRARARHVEAREAGFDGEAGGEPVVDARTVDYGG